MEDLPFPSQETDFSLPETEFIGKPRKKEELDIKLKDQRDKYKEIKREKDIKESSKKDSMLRDFKGSKDMDKKKEEMKKYVKEVEVKKDKFRDVKDMRKEGHKSSKGRSKGKDDLEESGTLIHFYLYYLMDYLNEYLVTLSNCFEASNGKKDRKDSESSRELLKRIPKRPTRQSVDSSSKASSSPRDTPPPKRRRI